METSWKHGLWQQFGAAIDMLDNALFSCPDELWESPMWQEEPSGFAEFWYIGYHTLFWLDLYLFGAVEGFCPPEPYGLEEIEAGLLPPRTYTKTELRAYLIHCRTSCQAIIDALTDERAQQRCRFSWGEASFGELLLYNMRHVQEHAAQLSLFLGQQRKTAANWVPTAQTT